MPPRSTPASLQFTIVAIALGLLAQLLVYAHSFKILPAGDDFPYVNEINRGQTQGPWALIRTSFTNQSYRPFTSVGIWLAGHGSFEGRPARLRALGFIAMAMYAFSSLGWMRAMKLSRLGVIVTLAALLFHPALPAALASIDGFNSLASSAMLWLGAWFVLKFRDRPTIAVVGVLVCFLLGAGFKEYVFALVPLSGWTAICLSRDRSMRYACAVFASAAMGFAIILAARHVAMSSGGGASLYLTLGPRAIAENIALFGAGMLFPGNSVWVYIHQNAMAYATFALSSLALIVAIAIGVLKSDRNLSQGWLIFLLGGLVIATFPAILTPRISEMYLTSLMLPFALLCALAAEGWRALRGRHFVLPGAIVALLACVITIRSKVDDMVSIGQRADRQLRQILSLLPADAHDLRVALRFDVSQMSPRRAYSVYRMGDDTLLVHPVCFEWLRPGQNLHLQSFRDGDPEFDPGKFDVVLRWNLADERFSVEHE